MKHTEKILKAAGFPIIGDRELYFLNGYDVIECFIDFTCYYGEKGEKGDAPNF
ncbi:MAG: hypothetical protein JRH15_05005 [Deltaproteobacteria bacterium]|nr:hypothetical protein [Deltaproteobacteria bacterium]